PHAPLVLQLHSREHAAVQSTLRIPHPTRYPLFTIIGYIFSLIPLPFSNIYKANLLAAFWCATGVSVFVYTAKYVLDNINSFSILRKVSVKQSPKKKKAKEQIVEEKQLSIPDGKKYASSVLAGL